MLAIARGLMSKPTILMLDEPSSGLAPMMVKNVFDVIQKINEEETTILLVEQNVHVALSIAKSAYVMENGRIVLNGNGSELLKDDRITKAYLGLSEK